MKERYECLEDRILVLETKSTESQKTEAGIITDTIKKETRIGTVMNAGPGRYSTAENGSLVLIPCVLRTGDTVLYGMNPGLPVTIPGEDGSKIECEMFRESDILMLISKKED